MLNLHSGDILVFNFIIVTMESNLTLYISAALFSAMFIMALMPSISAVIVSTKSAVFGFNHGVFTIAGIIAGDIIFIVIAIFGISVVTELTGKYFTLLKYIIGLYFVYLGFCIWRFKPSKVVDANDSKTNIVSSFMAGLLITLADQKAILFYFGFFPAFIDLTKITLTELIIIIALTVTAVASAKLLYALLANKTKSLLNNSRALIIFNLLAGLVMIAVGVLLVLGT